MGWDDHYLDSELSNLPEEAHENPFYLEGPFEPNNQWLSRAGKEDQEIAVREWFLARFCDPAMGTPYNGREGGGLFICTTSDYCKNLNYWRGSTPANRKPLLA